MKSKFERAGRESDRPFAFFGVGYRLGDHKGAALKRVAEARSPYGVSSSVNRPAA